MFRNLILIGVIAVQSLLAQNFQPIQGGDGRFQNLIVNDNRTDLSQRNFGTYYMDYLEYDRNYLNSTINNGVYGNLCFTNVDTSYGVIPYVATYYDHVVLSTDLQTWTEVPWTEVISFQVDSVFIKLNVDNSSGNPCKLKMKVVYPDLISAGGGNWYDFNIPGIWEDSIITTADIGTHTPTSISFATVGFDVGIPVTGKFAVVFEFSGSITDTCRLIWSYPTEGAACTNGSVSPPNTTPVKWDLYPTSFYTICTNGNGLQQNLSVGFPRISGSNGFAYFVDCSSPSTPYINDGIGNGFDGNKNQFQHWNMWAIVTVQDEIGLEENSTISSLKLFPNPVNDQLNISFSLQKSQDAIIVSIQDLSGKTVYSESFGSMDAGNVQKTLHPNLTNGTYFCKLTSGSESTYSKFVVMRN